MPTNHSRKKIWCGLALSAFALMVGLGVVAYQARTLDDEIAWGSPALDVVAAARTNPGAINSIEADAVASATEPATRANDVADGSNAEPLITAHDDAVMPAPLVSAETALSDGGDGTIDSRSGTFKPNGTDPVEASEPINLPIEDSGSAAGTGPVLASAGTTTPSLSGNALSGTWPGSPAPPTASAVGPTGDNTGAGPKTASAPPLQSPGHTDSHLGSTPLSPPTPVASTVPTASPIISQGAPAQSTGGGTPTSNGGASPPITTLPGQTPSNPITPIGSTPGGASILPVTAAACSGANCSGGPNWRFFDPPVAVGYDYALNPNTPGQSLTFGITEIMPTTKVGSGVYDLWLYDTITNTYVDSSSFSPTGQTITITADPSANPNGAFDVVQFLLGLTTQEDRELGISDPYMGFTQFSLRGIDPKAGVNPDDPNAFITGLLFAGSINGDLLITPLAVDSVTGLPVDPPTFPVAIPEPSTIALLVSALACLGILDRRRKPKLPRCLLRNCAVSPAQSASE